MATASTARSMPRVATRGVLLAVVVVLSAMVALALLVEALTSGEGGTVYLAEIQPSVGRPGSAPSLVVVGYGSASVPAERARVQLLFISGDGFYGGPGGHVPTAGATPGAAEQEAAAPIMAALLGAGIPETAIEVVTSGTFTARYYGGSGSQIFRIDLDLANPDHAVLTAAIDLAAQAALENGLYLFQTGAVYGVADCGPLRTEAWDAAVADARSRAAVQAARLGVELGDLLVSQEVVGDSPVGQERTGGCTPIAGPSGELGPGSATVTLPPFDPVAPPLATVNAQVSLAFEIVRG